MSNSVGIGADDANPGRKLNDQQRRFVDAYVGVADHVMWRAAQLAGYKDVDPKADLAGPEHKDLRLKLTKAGDRALRTPTVRAYLDYLEQRAAAEVLAGPEGAGILARVRDQIVVEHDVVKMRAQTLDLLYRISHADIGELASWDGHGVEVRSSEELPRELRQLIHRLEYTFCSKCGTGNGVKLELEPKIPALGQLAKSLGMFAPTKVELAGKDGGPIQLASGAAPGLTRETIEACRRAIVGRPPVAVSAV